LRVVRSITLKGAVYSEVVHEFVPLLIILAALIAMASTRFSKKLG
jgi:hypothetical protein